MRELTVREMGSIFGGEGGGSAGSSGGSSSSGSGDHGGSSNNGGSSGFDSGRFGGTLTASDIVSWYQKNHPQTTMQAVYSALTDQNNILGFLRAYSNPETASVSQITGYFADALRASTSGSGGSNHHN